MAKDPKNRAQVKINLDRQLKDRFDAEWRRRRYSPAQLASMILERFLEQPLLFKTLFLEGFKDIPAGVREEFLRYMIENDSGTGGEGFADRERRKKKGDEGEERKAG